MRNSPLSIYREKHCCCPTCGSKDFEETTVGYPILDPEKDKDINSVRCACGFTGIVHDLVPENTATR